MAAGRPETGERCPYDPQVAFFDLDPVRAETAAIRDGTSKVSRKRGLVPASVEDILSR
jgi:hypothetical protein